ncbi:MAG: DUF4174 domain-containing protein [Actinomycetota bacterium]|jgi:hypothetical protein|nr:DUF4174 domain-containing protein [Rubrobacter sp.]MDQ3508174.1 DUF4174 domain-containing protein [Actinomycetota bacterium]
MNDRLAEHEWRERLLIVFAPDESDEKLIEQKKLIEESKPGFEKRDLLPIYPPGDDEIHDEFGVGAGSFAAILVGKDGTEKSRFESPVEPEELFRRIDGMPMRRREMGRGS